MPRLCRPALDVFPGNYALMGQANTFGADAPAAARAGRPGARPGRRRRLGGGP